MELTGHRARIVAAVLAVAGVMIIGSCVFWIAQKPSPSRLDSLVTPPTVKTLSSADDTTSARVKRAYGQLPLAFEDARARNGSGVSFVSRGSGYALFLGADEATLELRNAEDGRRNDDLSLSWPATLTQHSALSTQHSNFQHSTMRMRLLNANAAPRMTGLDETAAKSHYFIGSDPRGWRTNVAIYGRVKYEAVYPGIDLVWYGNQQQLEHDFIVAPGADPRRIRMEFGGAQMIKVDEEGALVLQAGGAEARLLKPRAWQEVEGERREVACDFRLTPERQVEFQLGQYDSSETLVIDPVLLFASYLGGNGFDRAVSVAVEKEGSAYIVGETSSNDFPLPSSIQPAKGAFNDAFVLKLNSNGTSIVYATFLGGNNTDIGTGVAVDEAGSAYLTGYTFSTDFPTTTGALQTKSNGLAEAFVTKLNPSGSALSYSTLLGGNQSDLANGIAIDGSGNAYITGSTRSTDLPANGLQRTRQGNPVYRSINNGSSWEPRSNGLPATIAYDLAIDPVNSDTFYAGTELGVFKSTDGGNQWRATGTLLNANAVAIDPATPTTLYVGALSGLYKSTNGGETYTLKNSAAIYSLLIDPKSPMTVYAGTSSGALKSLNGGETWAPASAGMTDSPFQTNFPRVNKLVADPSTPATIYAATSRGAYKTTNGAGNWSVLSNGLSAFNEILTLAIDPVTPTTLYAGLAVGQNNLFKTTNGGASWSQSSNGLAISAGGLPRAVLIYSLAVDPNAPATVYAGTDIGGVFKSTDGGANWIQGNSGLNNVFINSLAIDRRNPANVLAGVRGGADAFVAKLNATGSGLSYLTYLGGDESELGLGIAVDGAGNAYIVGSTTSLNFPVANAVQATNGGFNDAFVTKLNPTGAALIFSTYLGGVSNEQGAGVAVSEAGNVYVAGSTVSFNFPLVEALQLTFNGFTTAFVARFNPGGSALDYSTFLGGSSSQAATGVAVDRAGNAYVAGVTNSSDFPVVDAVQAQISSASNEVFLTKLNARGAALIYSTYLGGSGSDAANGVAIDGAGNAYVVGSTSSINFIGTSPLPFNRGTEGFVVKVGVDADLAITQTGSRNPVMVNNPFSYTLTVTNRGPAAATGVAVIDQLPAGVAFVSANSSVGSCSQSAGLVSCNVGRLAPQAAATITILARPASVGAAVNTARVSGNEADSNPANNQTTLQTMVSASPSVIGRVTIGDRPLPGVTVRLSGASSGSQTTDSNGFYQFSEVQLGGSYSITPSLDNYSFEPALRSFGSLSADQTADFTATTCSYAVAPASRDFGAAGGSGTFTVTATPRCPWTASVVEGADWIMIAAGSAGTGNGAITINVAPTSKSSRAGRLVVAGQTIPIYQVVNACSRATFRTAIYRQNADVVQLEPVGLDGDGKLDLLGLLSNSSNIRSLAILKGQSDGSFIAGATTDLAVGALSFAVGDLNGDGWPDVAATYRGRVEVYPNDGAGGFGPLQIYPVTFTDSFANPAVRLFDFNRDGKLDLALYYRYDFQKILEVRVLLNNGAGGFKSPINIALGDSAPVGFTDANGDGNIDLLAIGGGALRLFPGDGLGGFGAPITSPFNEPWSNGAPGDFNGDGKPDWAILTGVAENSTIKSWNVTLFFGDGAGRFGSQKSYDVGGDRGELVVADLNGDAKPDVSFASFNFQTPTRLVALLGDGLGQLSAPAVLLEGDLPGRLVAADFDDDGRVDLTGGVSSSARVYLNRCSAGLSISGRVTDGETQFGLPGVTVRISGGGASSTQSDSGGNYEFKDLSRNFSYTLTAERGGFEFAPAIQNVNNIIANQVANFAAARKVAVVSAASFAGPAVAPESIAAAFGVQLTTSTSAATTSPLPLTLSNTSATLVDVEGASRSVRLFFISPGQVNFVVPPGVALGEARLTISSFLNLGYSISASSVLRIERVAPGLFTADANGEGLPSAVVLRIKSDGVQVYEPVARFDAAQGRFIAVPIDLGNPAEQVFLVLFGTGVRNRSALGGATAKIGGLDAEVLFAGPLEGFVGTDQINLRLPRALSGRGEVDVLLTFDGKAANRVKVNVR